MARTKESYHHGDLANALLGAAGSLLAEGGARPLTLRAVARRAGVSAMAPYRHFADREALLAAVAADGFARLAAALETGAEGATPGERLFNAGLAYIRFALTNPALYRLMFGPDLPDKGRHPVLVDNGAAALAACRRLVGACADGETPPEAIERRTAAKWAQVHGIAGLMLDGLLDDLPDDVEGRVAVAGGILAADGA